MRTLKVEYQITYLKRKFPKGIFVSALNQLRINILSKEIIKLMDEMYQVVDLKFSYTDSKAIYLFWLFENQILIRKVC